jgi:hypothetical protein
MFAVAKCGQIESFDAEREILTLWHKELRVNNALYEINAFYAINAVGLG